MATSVDNIKKYPFLKRPRVEQQQIVASGKPRPNRNLIMGPKCNGAKCFNPAFYDQVQWLTRCDKRRSFFCWPCLLFKPIKSLLKITVISDLSTAMEVIDEHEAKVEHLEAVLKLQIFIMRNFRTPDSVMEDQIPYNDRVQRNREVLKRLIDVVCCVVGQKHSHGHGKYTSSLINSAECLKALKLLRSCDKTNTDLIEAAIDFLNQYPRVTNDLVDSITRVLKMAVKNEICKSAYVSVILSQHAVNSQKSQISTVLRYINHGKVCERFIGFTNFAGCNSEDEILRLILNTIEEFDISDKFLAISLDGAVVDKQDLTSVISSVKIDYTYSYFVPWHSHGFGYVLLQTLSIFDECKLFLKTMNAIEIYFQDSERLKKFEFMLLSKNPELRNNKWYIAAPFIIHVAVYREYFIKYFLNIKENCKVWHADDITKGIAFRGFLGEFRTVFLLQLFRNFFSNNFDESFNFVTDSKEQMHVFNNSKISKFRKDKEKLKFDFVWLSVVAEVAKEGSNSKLKAELNDDTRTEYHNLYQSILGHLFQEIDIRCNYLSKLKFCELLNCDSSGKFICNPRLVSELMLEHGSFFGEELIRNEIDAMNANAAIFSYKSVHELLEYFAEMNLRDVLTQLYKLAEFVLTLPCLPACKNEKSKLKDIGNCSYIPEIADVPSGELSVLCVETEMLRELKKSSVSFYDDVTTKFYEVNQTLFLV